MPARPRRTPASSDLSRIVRLLDQGRDPPLGGLTADSESVPLLFAAGRRSLLHGERDAARTWLTRAQSRTTRRTPEPLRSRLAFELGCVLLDDGGSETAESVALWAESFSKKPASDVLHLRALIADRRGRRSDAIALYRRAIATSATALSPLSRVLELRNLAETLAHESPAEAVTMYRHALETLAANALDPRLAAALHNGLAYAAICAADLDLADRELDAAAKEAERLQIPLMRAYARYNRSITLELRDRVDEAVVVLREARATAESSKLLELVTWTWIREAWLALKRKDRKGADRASATARRTSGPAHAEALSTLDAFFALIDGDHQTAARLFDDLATLYLGRSDLLTAFALLLWRAVAYRKSNATKGAKATARRACELRRKGTVRVSPSWWAHEVVNSARFDGGESCAEDLRETAIGLLDIAHERVIVTPEDVVVDGDPLPADAWQRRSGARVLRRLFGLLVAAHPGAISRDELADRLWPDSEGDKAVRNLYAAMKDLRRVIASAPGLTLVAREGGYAIVAGPNVSITSP